MPDLARVKQGWDDLERHCHLSHSAGAGALPEVVPAGAEGTPPELGYSAFKKR